MKKYIAIVGPIGAGKTTVSDILIEEFGYVRYKISQGLYDEVERRGLERTRIILQDVGDDLRNLKGPGVLSKLAVEKLKKDGVDQSKKIVFESIRNHNEILVLQEEYGDELFVISVDTPLEVRYKRAVERKGQYNEQDTTFEEFKKIAERDLGKGNGENEQNVLKCMELADIEISNDGTLEDLKKKVETLVIS